MRRRGRVVDEEVVRRLAGKREAEGRLIPLREYKGIFCGAVVIVRVLERELEV